MTRWWRSHSLRVRLTIWYVFAMVIVLGVYAVAIYAFVTRTASNSLNQRLRGDFQWAAAMVDQTPEGRITWPQSNDDVFGEEDRPWLQVWSSKGDLLFRTIEAELRPLPQDRQLATLADNQIASVPTSSGVPMRVLSRRGRIVAGGPRVTIQVARSEGPMQQEVRQLVLILVLGFPLAVMVAGVGGYALARGALRPIERMTERAKTITAEELSARLPVLNRDDEMGQLATVFNETLARLEESFDQMRRFTTDVSHELRTPLTAIRSVGEVGLRGHRDESAYRAIVGSMLEEADRLATLVDRLLTLSRAERGDVRLSMEEIDLRALAEEVIAHLGVLAEEKTQSIVVIGDSVHAVGDRLVIRQALINLVDNAIKFSCQDGRIEIRVADAGRAAFIDVTDSGPGVSEAARGRLFDRFYRAPETSGETSGAGLGLSLAKGAIEASGGTLTLERSDENGSTFRVMLPRVMKPQRQKVAS